MKGEFHRGHCCSKGLRIRKVYNRDYAGHRSSGTLKGLSLFKRCDFAIRDMEVVSSVTKLLYTTIAKHFKTTDQKVERAIRNAIEVSWTRGNIETFEKLFGYSVLQGKNRPTNSEYIARIADKMRLDIKSM